MKPTVGRIVHYHSPRPALVPVQTADGQNVALEYNGPFAAIVAFVHGDGHLALDVRLPPQIHTLMPGEGLAAVPQSSTDKPVPGSWCWPPREG